MKNSKVLIFNLRLSYWYKKHKRDFPWRLTKDPYKLLIAEILLQKTNASKVVPIYEKIIVRYKDPESLSNADELELKVIIAPLGIARKTKVLINLGNDLLGYDVGNFSIDMLKKIKGVGEYISRSVIIHSRGDRLSLLDPNFIRIYHRVFGIYSSRPRPRTDRYLWAAAESLLPKRNISDYAYAMLDFGALMCKARNPNCTSCPMYSDICDGANI